MSVSITSSARFDGREYRNLDDVPAGRPLRDVFRWKLFGGKAAELTAPLPLTIGAFSSARVDQDSGVSATFVGHSTFLLQFANGLNVLTDPVWAKRVGPLGVIGPKRWQPPAIAFGQLPPIQLVLISHGHYDHLDLETLRQLERRDSPLFLTGLGNEAFLKKRGLRRVKELDWWQCYRCESSQALEVTFTPAQHWSKRSAGKNNDTLWGGFWLQAGELRIFFAGDTGLGNHFAQIRERLGSPDLAFLPIGAYEPRWFMRDQHMNPEDAVQAQLALAPKLSVGMHFGTFQLTDEAMDQPAIDLAAALTAHRIQSSDFVVPRQGETIRVSTGSQP